MSRAPINTSLIYHVYNRGVEKRNIFLDDGDRVRFMHYLYHFNKQRNQRNSNLSRDLTEANLPPMKQVGPASHNKLVDIMAFVLMPNHYHILVQQKIDGGLSTFMQRLGTGYTLFFNEKYRRDGVLFQGKYKYKALETEAHFLYIPHYIHLNPLGSVIEAGPTCFNELLKYKWSSLPNYVGGRSFPSVITTDLILDAFGGTAAYQEDFASTFESRSILENIEDIAIDWDDI